MLGDLQLVTTAGYHICQFRNILLRLDIFLELSLTILIRFLCLLFCLPVLLPGSHISQWIHTILWRWWQHCLETSSLNAVCGNVAHSCTMSLRLDASWWEDKNWMFLEPSMLLESRHVWWALRAHAVPKTWDSWAIPQLTSCSVVKQTGHKYLCDINSQLSVVTNATQGKNCRRVAHFEAKHDHALEPAVILGKLCANSAEEVNNKFTKYTSAQQIFTGAYRLHVSTC